MSIFVSGCGSRCGLYISMDTWTDTFPDCVVPTVTLMLENAANASRIFTLRLRIELDTPPGRENNDTRQHYAATDANAAKNINKIFFWNVYILWIFWIYKTPLRNLLFKFSIAFTIETS